MASIAEHPAASAATSATGDGAVVPVLVVGLFVTGACGLVYQTLWLRQLSLAFGVTVFAAATAVAVFMAGLALGARLAGRLTDRTRRPLQWYGLSEFAVGLLAIATPAAMAATQDVYVSLAGNLGDNVAVLTVLRLVLSFAVLIVPATLMGASTPLVVKAASARSGRVGQRTALLYATNTLGAIAGTMLAGFWLIGERGIRTAFLVAAAGNLIVGGLTVMASRLWLERGRAGAEARATAVPGTADLVRAPAAVRADRGRVDGAHREPARRLVLWVFAVSGFASLALEIVWFRVLSLYLESTTYAFSTMLAVVLAGIATGSFLVTALLQRPWPWLSILAWVEVAVGVAALVSFALLARSYDVIDALAEPLALRSGGERETLVFAVMAALPAALLLGVAFPIGVKLWAEGVPDTGEAVGRFYSLNLLGGIAGSLAAGFILLPLLGARGSLVLLSSLLFASGLVLLHRTATRVALLGGVTAAFALVAAVAVPDPWDAVLEHRFPGQALISNAEGVQSSVSVTETGDGIRTMYIDGLPQASNIPAIVAGHRLIGLLPMVLHPDPRDALVIGYGGGVTAGAVAAVPGVEVDIVELSAEVIDAAGLFEDVNGHLADRSNVRVRVDDGRNDLLLTDRRYDVITADIIQPRSPGAGKLWSKEYWELTRDALAPGGIMLQWVGSGRTVVEYDLIVRTFLEVFPHATLWSNGDLLVGTNEPLVLDPAAFERRFAAGGDDPVLKLLGLAGFEDLLRQYIAGPDELRDLVGAGPLLTDDHPQIEFWRSLHIPAGTPAPDISGLAARTDVSQIVPP